METSNLAWRIDELCSNAWPPLRQVLDGDWSIRLSQGLTRRANSVNPLRPQAAGLASVLDRAQNLYEGIGQCIYVRVPSFLDPALDRDLAGRGYTAEAVTLSLYRSLEGLAFEQDSQVALDETASEEWFRSRARLAGFAPRRAEIHRRIVSGIALPAVFAAFRQKGRTEAMAHAVLQGTLLTIASVETAADQRNRGLGLRTLEALLHWGVARGAGAVCLQVEAENPAARALYRKLGLTREIYRYHYRKAPPAREPSAIVSKQRSPLPPGRKSARDQGVTNALPLPITAPVAGLKLSGIHEVFLEGYGQKDVIPLWVGEGDKPTPAFIAEAATRAMEAGHTGYPPKRGIPPLRAAIASYESCLHGTRIAVERISVVSSGMAGIATLMACFAEAGDKVAVVTPIWPNAMAAVALRGAEVLAVPLGQAADGGFHLDMNLLEDTLKTGVKALFCASPGNPSGWVASREEQAQMLALCKRYGVWLIADEVYTRLYYGSNPGPGGAAPSLLSLAEPNDPVVVLQSFSKTWAMTGWRLGWLVHPPGFGEVFEKLIEYTTSGASHFSQYGSLAAITEGEAFVAEQVAHCRQQRDRVVQALASLPRITLKAPEGAFYALFAVEGMTDSLAGAKEILAKARVGLAPGSAFGLGGEGHLRLCFASSPDTMGAGLERLAHYFERAR